MAKKSSKSHEAQESYKYFNITTILDDGLLSYLRVEQVARELFSTYPISQHCNTRELELTGKIHLDAIYQRYLHLSTPEEENYTPFSIWSTYLKHRFSVSSDHLRNQLVLTQTSQSCFKRYWLDELVTHFSTILQVMLEAFIPLTVKNRFDLVNQTNAKFPAKFK